MSVHTLPPQPADVRLLRAFNDALTTYVERGGERSRAYGVLLGFAFGATAAHLGRREPTHEELLEWIASTANTLESLPEAKR